MRFGKVSRTSARTAGEVAGIQRDNFQSEETIPLATDICNGGMVTSIHSHKLENNQFSLVQGYNTIFDGEERRYGHSIITPTKPNSNHVLGYFDFKRFDSTIKIYRFTKSSVHLYSAGSWTAITGTALTGTDSDRFQTISFLDRLFFNNNGADELQEIDLAANTYAQAGNSEKYKYYTTIHNRIVGANLLGASPNPIQVGWSGDLNPTEWDNAVDPSAGNSSLLESSGGTGDDITGVFNIDNVLLVTREKSIWLAELSAVATLPFLFRQAIPGIGAGIPYAISQVRGGVAWFDKRLANVFLYNVGTGSLSSTSNTVGSGAGLIPIGNAIKNELTDIDPDNVFSAYDPKNNTYILNIRNPNTTKVAQWKYHFDTNDWTYDEMTNITGIWYLNFSRSSTTIGELVGTIGDLVGTIGGLSTNQTQITEFVGRTDGEILQIDSTLVEEAGEEFSSIIISKDFRLPLNNMSIAKLSLTFAPTIGGDVEVSYSIDRGETFTDYETIAIPSGNGKKQYSYHFQKNITCEQFMWKIEALNGRHKLVEYIVHVFPGSDSRATTS